MIPTNPIPEVPNYGSSAQYRDLPSEEQIRAGVIPLDSLPAAWWNALWNCTNTAVNDARSAVGTLINEICNAITGAGICINESCIDQLYQAIDTIRQRIGNAVTAGAVKSSSAGGQVTIENDGTMTMNGVGNAANLNTSAKVVVSAINELKTTYDCCISDLSGSINSVNNSKAPTSHVSSATTYGVGNADCYGHLKISDTYTSCVGAAADGVAASQQALYCVYCAISAAASLGNSAGCPLGTASAGTATTAARSDHVHPTQNYIPYTGPSNGVVTAYQTDSSWCGSASSWASYLIFSHGNGETYYNQMIRMPFYDVPQYQRKVDGANSGWHTFITSENISSQTVSCASSANTLNGYGGATGLIGNSVVLRDANGYICASYFISSISDEDINSYSGTALIFSGPDKWFRRTPPSCVCVGTAGYAYGAGNASYADTAGSASNAGSACTAKCIYPTITNAVCTYQSCLCNRCNFPVLAFSCCGCVVYIPANSRIQPNCYSNFYSTAIRVIF